MTYVETVIDEQIPENNELRDIYSGNIKMLENFCQSGGVPVSVQHLKNPSSDNMIQQTRFADMLIVDPEMSLDNSAEDSLPVLLKNYCRKANAR